MTTLQDQPAQVPLHQMPSEDIRRNIAGAAALHNRRDGLDRVLFSVVYPARGQPARPPGFMEMHQHGGRPQLR